MAMAPTGSGKTLAFLIPIVTMLGKVKKGKSRGVARSLVRTPFFFGASIEAL